MRKVQVVCYRPGDRPNEIYEVDGNCAWATVAAANQEIRRRTDLRRYSIVEESSILMGAKRQGGKPWARIRFYCFTLWPLILLVAVILWSVTRR